MSGDQGGRSSTGFATGERGNAARFRIEEMAADGALHRAGKRAHGQDPNLTQRRPLYVIAALLMIAAIGFQFSPLFVAGLLVLVIAFTPELWYRYGLRGVVMTRETDATRVAFGGVFTSALTIENRKPLPLPLVGSADELPDALPVLGARLSHSSSPGHAVLNQAIRLWTYQRVRRRVYLRATQRGAYILGPTVVRVGDPFGIMTREEYIETQRVALVHPLVAPLERFGLQPRAPFGDQPSRLRLLEDPLRVVGVRDYVAGDDPRRIHWKATARAGTLQSKVLDPSTQQSLLIALDVRTFRLAQFGFDPDISEFNIALAASLAAWASQQGYAVGLISNGLLSPVRPGKEGRPVDGELGRPQGRETLTISPSARPEQLQLILDGLARLSVFGGGPIAPALEAAGRALPSGAAMVFVGLESVVEAPTIAALRRINQRGHAVLLALTTREDDSETESDAPHNLGVYGLPIHYAGGRAEWRALVAEALGDLPARMAHDPVSEEHLAIERSIIRRMRRQRGSVLSSTGSGGMASGADTMGDVSGEMTIGDEHGEREPAAAADSGASASRRLVLR